MADVEPDRDIDNVSATKGDISETLYIDPAAEKSYVRKLDLYLLPVLSLMYFCRFTTGGNIGNAKVRFESTLRRDNLPLHKIN